MVGPPLQETFIRVHGARERYSADARFSTWLFRIGRNLALNELDRAHRRLPHFSTEAIRADNAPPPSRGRFISWFRVNPPH
jgi:DNA-directed RNA polymerase specialized sigma24 family protein